MMLLPYAFVSIFFSNPVINSGECGVVKDEKVLAARAYHGLLISFEDENGEWFERNGERCKLFTDAFLKKYERRER